jgi:hypothetical protein
MAGEPKHSNNSRFARKAAVAFLIAVFCAGLLSNVYIHLSYSANMPRNPEIASGRIFQVKVNHGTLVYVTQQELDRAKIVFGFGSYVTLGVGLLLVLVRIYWVEPTLL